MSLLVNFSKRVETKPTAMTKIVAEGMKSTFEVNADKILSVSERNGRATITVESGKGTKRYDVEENAQTVKNRIEAAEIERAVAVSRARNTSQPA